MNTIKSMNAIPVYGIAGGYYYSGKGKDIFFGFAKGYPDLKVSESDRAIALARIDASLYLERKAQDMKNRPMWKKILGLR